MGCSAFSWRSLFQATGRGGLTSLGWKDLDFPNMLCLMLLSKMRRMLRKQWSFSLSWAPSWRNEYYSASLEAILSHLFGQAFPYIILSLSFSRLKHTAFSMRTCLASSFNNTSLDSSFMTSRYSCSRLSAETWPPMPELLYSCKTVDVAFFDILKFSLILAAQYRTPRHFRFHVFAALSQLKVQRTPVAINFLDFLQYLLQFWNNL